MLNVTPSYHRSSSSGLHLLLPQDTLLGDVDGRGDRRAMRQVNRSPLGRLRDKDVLRNRQLQRHHPLGPLLPFSTCALAIRICSSTYAYSFDRLHPTLCIDVCRLKALMKSTHCNSLDY